MLCYVMLCYVMLCYVMLCYVMLCYVMLCYTIALCCVMLRYVILCHVYGMFLPSMVHIVFYVLCNMIAECAEGPTNIPPPPEHLTR